MKIKKYRYFVGDFETTVYKGQVNTEVWASALVELYHDDVEVLHSIGETFDYLKNLDSNVIVYYHNLKFDGSFWLSYLMVDLGLEQAFIKSNEAGTTGEWALERDMHNNTFKYSISDKGQWYTIIIKVNNHFIELRDSLKLLPFAVRQIGEGFKTKHRKLDMEYTGFRYAGCEITPEEKEYIKNDVLVVKEALEVMFNEGHKKLTIGSCCLEEYKHLLGKEQFASFFPNVYEMELDPKEHTYLNVGQWVRKSYKGGWCFVVPGKTNQVKGKGTTADVNSLYPSMMSSESGNRYPIGRPIFWKGNTIPLEALAPDKYYFVRIRTRFYLKKDYLPFIQIKGNYLYRGTECLTTSDIWDKKAGIYKTCYRDTDGDVHQAIVELTLTMTDYELIKEHYHLVDCEILDGCYFRSAVGIFDDYIDKYKKIKLESKGALRTLAKLFLNNLYGKMASNTDSSFKVAYVKDDKSIGFFPVVADDKEPGFIPVGSAITSYARNFTIRAAQKNYYGVDKPGFIYADTDSIHCDLQPEEIKGITVHERNFCCWKLESCWDSAVFARQKTYVEHVTHEDLIPVEPYYDVKCAGMPSKCKDLFVRSIENWDESKDITDKDKKFTASLSKKEIEFCKQPRTLADFRVGLCVPGKLRPVRIRGGVLLVETTYNMHPI